MYICIFVYMYICIYVYMYICIYVYMCICIYVYMCICIYVVNIYIYIYVCICISTHSLCLYLFHLALRPSPLTCGSGGRGAARGLSRPGRLPGLSQQRGRLPGGAAGHRQRRGGSQEDLFEGTDGDGFLLM